MTISTRPSPPPRRGSERPCRSLDPQFNPTGSRGDGRPGANLFDRFESVALWLLFIGFLVVAVAPEQSGLQRMGGALIGLVAVFLCAKNILGEET